MLCYCWEDSFNAQWQKGSIVVPVCTKATVVLISIGHHHWRWIQGEDFLWRHQPDSSFILVKQLKATVEKVAILCHILLHPLRVLKRFFMNIAWIAPNAIYMNDHINARIEEQVLFIRNLRLARIIGGF